MSAPSASAPPALAVERLNAWYGAAQVLYDVAFTVELDRRSTDQQKNRLVKRLTDLGYAVEIKPLAA